MFCHPLYTIKKEYLAVMNGIFQEHRVVLQLRDAVMSISR